jgi:hypothetical protein
VGLLHRLYLLQATNGFRKWFETRLVMLLASAITLATLALSISIQLFPV